MRGEHGKATTLPRQVLDQRPSRQGEEPALPAQRHPTLHGSATGHSHACDQPLPELVEQQQARGAQRGNHALHVLDLARKAAQALLRLVLLRHPNANRVEQGQLSVLRLTPTTSSHRRGNEAPTLRDHAQHADLSKKGALPRAVRPQHELDGGERGQQHVVRSELLLVESALSLPERV